MDEPLRVEVSRSGGFAGRVLRWEVTLTELPPEAAEEVVCLLADAPSWPSSPGVPDGFRWRIVTTTDIDVVVTDPAPAPAERLITLVREAASPR